MVSTYAIATLLGWLALPASILRYQARSYNGVLIVGAMAAFLFAGHYAMLGAYPGAILTGAGGVTALAQVFVGRKLGLTWRMVIAVPSLFFALSFADSDFVSVLAFVCFFSSRFTEVL